MSITAQTAVIGFGLQAAKGTDATTFYRHRAMQIQMGIIAQQDTPPAEIGGGNNPTGVFKTGAFFGGQVTILPRLEESLGWLLAAATGRSAVTTANGTVATLNDHVFAQGTSASFLPWMTWRVRVPGSTTANDHGEQGRDCKISSLTFQFPQSGPLQAAIEVQGLYPTYVSQANMDNPTTGWTYANTYEAFDSVPLTMTGSFGVTAVGDRTGNTILTNPITAVGASVSFINALTPPQQERIIGSYYPSDTTVKQRVLQIDMTVKHNDPQMTQFWLNGGSGDVFAQCLQYTGFLARVTSPCNVSAADAAPYALEIYAPRVAWEPAGPIQLSGDELLVQKWRGIAVVPLATGVQDYYQITLTNNASGYTLV